MSLNFDTNYIPREYRSGSITHDKDCQKQSERIEISITLNRRNPKHDNDIPVLGIQIRNKGRESFIFRNRIMIHIFYKDSRKFIIGDPAPYQGTLNQLEDIDCKGTYFERHKKEWQRQPNLKTDSCHMLNVPLVNFDKFDVPSEKGQNQKLTDKKLRLKPGKYQILVSYFDNYTSIRKLSNTIEYKVDTSPPDKKLKK
jgi:hypothetical protein